MRALVEVSHVVAEWAFTLGLKKLRENSENSNQSEIARRIGKSRATIGHYEMGRYLPSHENIDIMMDAYGHPARAAYYRELRDRVEAHPPDWWEDEFPGDFPPKSLALFAGFECSAVEMRVYDTRCVPELFQTRAYAEAVLRAGLAGHGSDRFGAHLRMLRGRQAALDRADPPTLRCVLEEAVLRRVVGGPDVLDEQLGRLADLAREPHIDIRVLTEDKGCPAGAAGAFTEMLLPPDVIQDFPDVVYVTTPVDRIHYESPEDLSVFRALWDRLWDQALSPEESLTLLTEMRQRLAERTS